MLALEFQPFGADEIAEFLSRTRTGFIAELVATGDALEDAERHADANYERYFPDGSPAPGQLVGRLINEGKPIGRLWLGPIGNDPTRWWVFSVEIDDDRRGQGFGRQAMLLAETLARHNGAVTIGLNVFARNAVARRLYESLDYALISLQMAKEL